MARRDLLAEAQAQAQAQVAPQVYALQEALQAARADRNSAIRAAVSSYTGLSGAIHRAGPQVRGVYRDAAKSARGSDLIARKTLGGLDSSPGVDTIKAAYAHEGAVGGAVVAKSLASRLADLSDRRIAAKAGQVYAVNKANSDYSAAAATNASRRQALAAQQGLLTASNFSKLTEAAANRKNQRLMQQRSLDSQASLQASQQAFTAHENALGRRSDRINARIGAESDASKQQFTAGENAKDRALRLRIAKMGNKGGASGVKADPKQTQIYLTAVQNYRNDQRAGIPMRETAAEARKAGVPEPIINAAADYVSREHIRPQTAKELQAIGVAVPKAHIGVQVRPYTRRRRSK